MTKKKLLYVCGIVGGIILLTGSMFLRSAELKTLSGVALGIGISLFGLGLNYLIVLNGENKRPDVKKQNEIEFNDERNTMIRNRAKAKSADIVQWSIMGVAYITILIDSPMWVTFITVSVFLLHNILTSYYVGKYQKEM